MTMRSVVRFDEALQRAIEVARARLADFAAKTVIVRDLNGRIRIALDDRGLPPAPEATWRETIAAELTAALDAYAVPKSSAVLLATQMMEPDELFSDEGCVPVAGGPEWLSISEKTITGSDWVRSPLPDPGGLRLALFGAKGGVGRTTAATLLAWQLSEIGKRVLIVDLDLESPGVASVLLAPDQAGDFGVVDWLVEDAVGQSAGLMGEMIVSSTLETRSPGRGAIHVLPAAGRERSGYEYIPKLSRAYLDVRDAQEHVQDLATRVGRMLSEAEASIAPDITILDSRAGIHDLAAIALTRLNATSLLFAVDSPQTWRAYELLFRQWQSVSSRTKDVRERLKMVASSVPESATSAYLDRFVQHSYACFAKHVYEEAVPGDMDAFNYDLHDSDAPHSPLRIPWSRTFMQFDPIGNPGGITSDQIDATYGEFVRGVHTLVFAKEWPPS